MSVIEAFNYWNLICKEFEEMQPPTEHIVYFKSFFKPITRIKKVLENE